MPCVITMKDTLVHQTVDESFADLCAALNSSMSRGMQFIALDGVDGEKIMFNIPNIMVVNEVDED